LTFKYRAGLRIWLFCRRRANSVGGRTECRGSVGVGGNRPRPARIRQHLDRRHRSEAETHSRRRGSFGSSFWRGDRHRNGHLVWGRGDIGPRNGTQLSTRPPRLDSCDSPPISRPTAIAQQRPEPGPIQGVCLPRTTTRQRLAAGGDAGVSPRGVAATEVFSRWPKRGAHCRVCHNEGFFWRWALRAGQPGRARGRGPELNEKTQQRISCRPAVFRLEARETFVRRCCATGPRRRNGTNPTTPPAPAAARICEAGACAAPVGGESFRRRPPVGRCGRLVSTSFDPSRCPAGRKGPARSCDLFGILVGRTGHRQWGWGTHTPELTRGLRVRIRCGPLEQCADGASKNADSATGRWRTTQRLVRFGLELRKT